MKKYSVIFLAFAAVTAMLSGCAERQIHQHQFSDTWGVDFNKHWKSCVECGETSEESTHTPDDSNICTVCGAELLEWDDYNSLWYFNENGDPLKMADYDKNGNVITESVYEYKYDADGNLIYSVETTDGVITGENSYTVVDGESVASQYIGYMDDGSKFVNEYDEYGNTVRIVTYDSDGNEDTTEDREYALSADEQWYESKCVSIESDGSKVISEYSEMGDQTGVTRYDADGNFVFSYLWEYTYDDDGNWQNIKEYLNDALHLDTVYATVTTEDGSMTYPETVTKYNEEGGKTVTVYDAENNIISETHYDANGNVISE